MTSIYDRAAFPPGRPTDRRLEAVVCPELTPVEELHRNDWFAVRNRGGYFTVEYHERQVIVLPLVASRAVVLVRVKRPVLGDCTLELPAGGCRDDESAVQAASRELGEEAGIQVANLDRFVPMPPLATSPNRIPTLIHVFKVDVTEDEFAQRNDHDEEIEGVELIPFPDVVRKMASGEIYVTAPMAILGSYLLTRGA